MPKTSKNKLKYMADYQKQPEVAEKGVARRKARRHAIADGKVAIGDGLEIDHKVPLRKGGAKTDANTRVVSGKENAGWRKGKTGYDK